MFNRLKYFFIKADLKKSVKQELFSSGFRSKIAHSEEIEDSLDILKIKSKSFSTTLLDFIDEKKMTDVECYKKANIDRKLFSKIRSREDYKPSKNTVLAFSIALKLNLQETKTLLECAGYSLSHSFITDIILEYFINKKKYNINLVNIALNEYKQQSLSGE